MPAQLVDDNDQLIEKLEQVLRKIFERFDKVRVRHRCRAPPNKFAVAGAEPATVGQDRDRGTRTAR
ncbi:hypothetical protein BC937DRAFT_90626 [Endogone sp. FLAS-F59071]|nr:hypothetical protein BC937DRAFT_90626 [Endogone sp. FLAS-F59071]|eukprot:RUS16946.1 hypothetical protein BC937DRAFT_90626 [Endogone sp. FLAS-F59071]